jgi:predicted ribosomally synthesized peptide with nif11-like leader
MTVETVAKFYQESQNDTQLMEQLKKAESPESFVQQTMQLGQEKGYVFTTIDIASYLSQQQIGVQLSDQELGVTEGPEACLFRTRFTGCFFITSCWASIC